MTQIILLKESHKQAKHRNLKKKQKKQLPILTLNTRDLFSAKSHHLSCSFNIAHSNLNIF